MNMASNLNLTPKCVNTPPKSTATPQLRPELVDQMQTYQAAVQQIYPGETVRAAFLTVSGDVVELPRQPTENKNP